MSRLGAWWKRRRLRRLAEAAVERDVLREFVYLDERSVTSLLASLVGALPKELMETTTRTSGMDGAVERKASRLLPGVKAGGRVSVSRSDQIVRRALIQSHFRDLTKRLGGSVRITDRADSKMYELLQSPGVERGEQPLSCPARELARGDILDLEVELHAEDIYTTHAVLNVFFDVFFEQFGDQVPPDVGIDIARRGNQVLTELMEGLVPVRARCKNLRLQSHDDGAWLRPRTLATDGAPGLEIELVGMAAADLFWQDVRQVLFGRNAYRMLCRVAVPDFARSWSPVILGDVLRELMPGIPFFDSAAAATLWDVMKNRAGSQDGEDDASRLRLALGAFMGNWLTTSNVDVAEAERLTHVASVVPNQGDDLTVHEQREAFKKLHERLVTSYDLPPLDPESLALRRDKALKAFGLGLEPITTDPAPPAATSPVEGSRVLQVEIISLSW